MLEDIKTILNRDLEKLKYELLSYKNEKNIWKTTDGIANSTGNLSLHLIGNLRTYIGLQLGHIPYVRDREAEFSLKNVSRDSLLNSIDETVNVLSNTLEKIKGQDLHVDHAFLIWEEPTSIEYMLLQLCCHLNYHLGQVNYHRRILDK